jgi:hypothetical protein
MALTATAGLRAVVCDTGGGGWGPHRGPRRPLGVGRYGRAALARARPFPPETLRLDLGRSLALALEFLLGADILRTAVEPTWEEIARLAAIAAIRTGLNYFLQRELREEARRNAEAGLCGPGPAAVAER